MKRGVWLELGLAVVVAMALVAVSCSGDSGGEPEQLVGEPVETSPDAVVDLAAGQVGLLIVQPSFGFGLYALDAERGEATALTAPAEVDTIDLGRDVIVSNGAGFALGSTLRDGQSSASDISVVRVNLVSGAVTQLVVLGPERETDADEGGTSYSLVAVVEDHVVVRVSDFGSGEGSYVVYHAGTGEQRASFDEPVYSFESDAGSCTGGIADLSPLGDGRLVGTTLGRPATLDVSTGDIELLGMCGQSVGRLGDLMAADQLGRYGVFSEGPALSDDAVDQLLDVELVPRFGVIEAWGDLWWLTATPRTVDGAHALVGGLVQFDPASRAITAIHSLGVDLGSFVDCEAGDPFCESQTIEQAQMRVVGDRLVIMDGNENGRLLLFDRATAAVTPVELERGATDFTSATLLAGNPDEIWVEVRRMTITKDDETGRASFGPSFIERLDPDRAQIDRSFPAEEIFFS